MTLYPLVIHIGPLTITGFGIMMMVGFLMAGWVIQIALRERGLSERYAEQIIIAGVVGGILGAKIWYVALYHDTAQFFSRGGLVWYGGFILATAVIVLNGVRLGVPMRLTTDLAVPGLALGHALGRVGCFLIQDDYGIPTSLPWGVKFPEGSPPTTAVNLQRWGIEVPENALPTDVLAVHPTQLYEVLALMLIFWLLWRFRHNDHATGWLTGLYLVASGIERFLVEFIRAKDDRLLAGFTLAQLASVVAVAVGFVLLAVWHQKTDADVPTTAKILSEDLATET
ncbi:MAG: prolipoprotein diacylglyceryl transferase [Gemmatimonadales bacterium]